MSAERVCFQTDVDVAVEHLMTTSIYRTSDDTSVYARVLQTLLFSKEEESVAGEPSREYPTLNVLDMLKGLLDHPTLVLIAYFILFMILRRVLGIV